MRRLTVSLLLALLAGLALGGPAPAATGCGSTGADYKNSPGGAFVRITLVRGIGCARAKAIVRQCIRNPKVPGWTAGADASGPGQVREILRRGSMKIVWYGTAGGSPTCTRAAVDEATSERS